MSNGELSRKDNSIVFRNAKGNIYLPIEATRELYCLGEVSFNTKFLDFIAKAGIVLHVFNYYQQYSGTYYPKEYLVSGNLVIKQAKTFMDSRIEVAKAFVRGIAVNIHEVLYHYYKHDKKELKEYLDWLKRDMPTLLDKQSDIKHVLFIEGQIWMKFYESFKYFLPEDFVMNKRVKRPPDNPINALISFGNSILYTRTISQIYNTHLDQSISFLHEPSEGRFSLCLDLSEAFKPAIVYKTIFELVNNRRIQVAKHFDKKLNYCLLNEAGKKIFVEALEERFDNVFTHPILKRKISYENAIKYDGYKLIKLFVEGKEFKPFSLKEMM
ncbi:type I-B CRISPR-associated endonuclease Cas1 [Clostridium sp. 19966]|uniref:type I-B CRISPR-associated endonuclease Cas1b n=1 Tax=Clostridium sp. 19966 TaxID=2768166 RepID=UPI0028E00DDD|nr:type I-B CRISPR-associated endonuclease Cas1b [Clostridium sp. 19966]MDT8719410.1 type I-B CRISPR-associated endonuclease Cas1 [Clostridium sp. 19966]